MARKSMWKILPTEASLATEDQLPNMMRYAVDTLRLFIHNGTSYQNVNVTYRGAWSNTTGYKSLDIVRYNGSAWIALMPNIGVTPVEGTTWSLFVQKGDVGATGPAGPQGAQGIQGIQGLTGPQGNTVLYGSGAPSNAIGADGNFYINTASNMFYGPKASGVWPAGTSIVGPQGNTVLYGSGAPASDVGSNGNFYIDTAAHVLYGPKASGAWPAGTSLIGPQGSTGPQGATGAQGPTGPQGPAFLSVDSNDVLVASGITSLDFSTAFSLNQSPVGEVNIAANLGTGSTQLASGNRGLPAGGASGTALIKNSASDYDVAWGAASGGDIVAVLLNAEVSITAVTILTNTAFGKMHVLSGTSDYVVTLPAASTNAGKMIGFRVPYSVAAARVFTLSRAGTDSGPFNSNTFGLVAGDALVLECTGSGWQPVTKSLVNPRDAMTPYQTTSNISNGDITLSTTSWVNMVGPLSFNLLSSTSLCMIVVGGSSTVLGIIGPYGSYTELWVDSTTEVYVGGGFANVNQYVNPMSGAEPVTFPAVSGSGFNLPQLAAGSHSFYVRGRANSNNCSWYCRSSTYPWEVVYARVLEYR